MNVQSLTPWLYSDTNGAVKEPLVRIAARRPGRPVIAKCTG
jgi:hypothetical protein